MNVFRNVSYASDKETISPNWDNLSVKYHYNFIENTIIEHLPQCESVFDVGPGYGHWIDFYQQVYRAEVDFIDISRKVQMDIQTRYGIHGHHGSIHKFVRKERFDVVNAIGVLHHIMNDSDLIRAIGILKEMANHYVIIGTMFDPARNDKHRKIRPLDWWINHLGCSLVISPNTPDHCIRHMDVIIHEIN